MLLRPGQIPTAAGWAFEIKFDGFRAIMSTAKGLQVRSRRAWNMTDRVPELAKIPRGLVLDGELVAFNEHGAPHWPLVCDRVLHGHASIPVTFVAFDVLRVNGHDLTPSPWAARRAVLEELDVETWCSRLTDVFDDGQALFEAVCQHGLEGIVAQDARDASHLPEPPTVPSEALALSPRPIPKILSLGARCGSHCFQRLSMLLPRHYVESLRNREVLRRTGQRPDFRHLRISRRVRERPRPSHLPPIAISGDRWAPLLLHP